jgi:hypothetical protein
LGKGGCGLTITEKAKDIPVIFDADVCVVGGSCTGVFAAVRAARLGAKVAVIEKQNAFGGVAASAFVNIWHSVMDIDFKDRIISGLTMETIERLAGRGAVIFGSERENNAFRLNTEELKIELDKYIEENHIKPFLCTFFCAPYIQSGELRGVFVENKSGRGVITASVFIDASGDGDLCSRLGIGTYVHDYIQPPSATAKLYGLGKAVGSKAEKLIYEHRREYGLPEDWGWSAKIPEMPELSFSAETHVFGLNCADGDGITQAEIEGRRQVRAVCDLLRKYSSAEISPAIAALPSGIGIRETRHISCLHRLTQREILYGVKFDDAIANGTYCVDLHLSDRPGILVRFLDGRETYSRFGYPTEKRRWRTDAGVYPKYYQIPYRSLLPDDRRFKNIVIAGRSIDADEGAFGAVRVMVNTNQMGEAAGTAAYLALDSGTSLQDIDTDKLRYLLKSGGSAVM